MSDRDRPSQQNPNDKQPLPNLRNALLDKHINEKKKTTKGWNKIRETVSENNVDGVFCESPTSSTTSSPASTRSTTPKPGLAPPKKQSLNPFLRNQQSSTLDIIYGDSKPTLSNTTLVAAQAAGLTNFSRNFRTPGHKNGVIYATSTAVQQDIYRLERDLDKLLVHSNSRSQNASFTDSISALADSTIIMPPPPPERFANNTFNSSVGKRSVFYRQSVAEMFHNNSSTSNAEANINEVVRDDSSRISSIMSSIMESIIKHKSATRLPLTTEILAVLSVPFDKSPFLGENQLSLAIKFLLTLY